MNYQLSQDGKTIKGMPEMEKPDNRKFTPGGFASLEHHKKMDKYNKHIAPLPSFPVHPSLSEKYEPGAVLVEGKDFELMDYCSICSFGYPCSDKAKHGHCEFLGKTAFPIAVREDDVSSLTNSPIGSSHWFNTHLGFFKRTGEYLQKHGAPPNDEVGAEWGKQLYERSEEILKWFHTLTPKQ